MKLVLDIEAHKVEFILELLKQYPYVKVKPLTAKQAAKAQFLRELEEAVEEVKLYRAGKIELNTLDEFLKEL